VKKLLIAFLAASILISSSVAAVSAKPDKPLVLSDKGVEKVVFIHYKAPGKPPWAGGPKDKPQEDDQGYKLFRGGVKWSNEDLGETGIYYEINIDNAPAGAFSEIAASFEEWDDATSEELFDNNPRTTTKSGADPYDGNVVSWTNLEDTRIIAVTTFWIWRGTKELAAFDIEFNTQFDWGINGITPGEANEATGSTSFMDVRNIATHEAGHTLVLEDLYQDQYAQMTMYGYSTEGEVKKISLEAGDIAGVQALYGG